MSSAGELQLCHDWHHLQELLWPGAEALFCQLPLFGVLCLQGSREQCLVCLTPPASCIFPSLNSLTLTRLPSEGRIAKVI